MNTSTTTFTVSCVKRARKPLPEVAYLEAVNALVHNPHSYEAQCSPEVARPPKTRAAAEGAGAVAPGVGPRGGATIEPGREAGVAGGAGRVEACSRYHGRLLAGEGLHPVLSAMQCAFTDHRPLCLSPDMIWLLLTQGVAHHVNVHKETLRARLVEHDGKVDIEVRRDDFVKGSPENPWEEVIGELSRGVRDHIGEKHDLFVPRFSTTGATERIAAEIVLLDAMKSYFTYSVMSICGIPAITLEGEEADWRELAVRAQAFAEFGLEWWLTPLKPVLEEFAAAAGGRVWRSFWESIYKYQSFSGGDACTGWILAFFPYLSDDKGRPTVRNPWLGERKLAGLLAGEWAPGEMRMSGPKLLEFPNGLAAAPFSWRTGGETHEMEFLGGFVGVAQDRESLILRPEIGWAVRCAPGDRGFSAGCETLAQITSARGPLSAKEAVGYASAVLRLLEEDHARGLLQVDLRATNLYVAETGQVVVVDPVVVKAAGGPRFYATGRRLPDAYLLPEDLTSAPCDARSNVYSVGVLLYEMVTGRLPHHGKEGGKLYSAISRGTPDPPSKHNPEVPPGLEEVILTALANDRNNRFQNVAAFRHALEDSLENGVGRSRNKAAGQATGARRRSVFSRVFRRFL